MTRSSTKMMIFAQVALVCPLILLVSSQGQEEFSLIEGPKHSVILRAPRSLGNFFRRMWGKSGSGSSPSVSSAISPQPGYPGGSGIPNGPFPASATSFYPSYSYPGGAGGPFAPPAGAPVMSPQGFSPFAGSMPGGPVPSGPMPGPFGPSPFGGSPSYGPYGGAPSPAASSAYPAYSPVPMGHPPSGYTPDFHSVLDNFVRSTGLSPMGPGAADQDMASSSAITSKGDTPVFSFKKLYSFPFYLSSDNRSPDGFNLNIPYMKQHIRRMNTGNPDADYHHRHHAPVPHVKAPRTAVYYRPDGPSHHHHHPVPPPLPIKKDINEVYENSPRIPMSMRQLANFYPKPSFNQFNPHQGGLMVDDFTRKVNNDLIREHVMELLTKKMNNDMVREQIVDLLSRKINSSGEKDSDRNENSSSSIEDYSVPVKQSIDSSVDQMETESRQKPTYALPPNHHHHSNSPLA